MFKVFPHTAEYFWKRKSCLERLSRQPKDKKMQFTSATKAMDSWAGGRGRILVEQIFFFFLVGYLKTVSLAELYNVDWWMNDW
jgi:hypothetical protein